MHSKESPPEARPQAYRIVVAPPPPALGAGRRGRGHCDSPTGGLGYLDLSIFERASLLAVELPNTQARGAGAASEEPPGGVERGRGAISAGSRRGRAARKVALPRGSWTIVDREEQLTLC